MGNTEQEVIEILRQNLSYMYKTGRVDSLENLYEIIKESTDAVETKNNKVIDIDQFLKFLKTIIQDEKETEIPEVKINITKE